MRAAGPAGPARRPQPGHPLDPARRTPGPARTRGGTVRGRPGSPGSARPSPVRALVRATFRPTGPQAAPGSARPSPVRALVRARIRTTGPETTLGSTRPGPVRALVRARFRLTGADAPPGVTVRPGPGAVTAGAAATRALREAGLAHLGGHLDLRTYGRAPRQAETARAVRRAVHRALATRRT
ncbi:hypothetical protein ACFC5X_29655 [Streptomyces sp. NPDC055952]|uniref:hypothetical protein n=1 Tax=Streptomyces sp. NPDC055952 TaxID=3345663 RepID=UPI0035DD3EAF